MSARRILNRNEIVGLLTEVGQFLDEQGTRGELFVVGGAAMALAYDARRLTADIDAVFEPKSMVYEAIRHVAQRHGLADGWINDAVKSFLPSNETNIRVVLEVPGLRVSIPSTEYLLALKVHAARPDRDLDDIRYLADHLGLTTSSQILDVAERFFGANRLEPKSQFFIEQLFGAG